MGLQPMPTPRGRDDSSSQDSFGQILVSPGVMAGLSKRGGLVGVVGPVGSGKTSLLLGIMGQLWEQHQGRGQDGSGGPRQFPLPSGRGQLAFASQKSWLQKVIAQAMKMASLGLLSCTTLSSGPRIASLGWLSHFIIQNDSFIRAHYWRQSGLQMKRMKFWSPAEVTPSRRRTLWKSTSSGCSWLWMPAA